MAQKDKAKWLELFYNRWGYKPTAEIRKKPEYAKKVSLEEALQIAEETEELQPAFLIQVVFPFSSRYPISKQSSDSVTIFPQTVYYDKNSLYEIDEPILYGGMFYSLDDFISKCPDISLDNAEGMFGTYTFSLPFFMLEAEEAKEFRKLYLTPIKSKIVETGIYPEHRGTGKKQNQIRAERDKFIIEEYKKMPRKKPLPISAIKQRLIKKSMEFKDKPEQMNEYDCTEITIRRVLQKYINK